MDINQEIKAIDQEIERLQRERRKLDEERIADLRKSYRPNIGRCFKKPDGEYVAIIDVPIVKNTLMGFHFNEYQFPCITLASESEDRDMPVPIWDDTAYSPDGITFGADPMTKMTAWTEIPREQFEQELLRRVCWMFELVDGKNKNQNT